VIPAPEISRMCFDECEIRCLTQFGGSCLLSDNDSAMCSRASAVNFFDFGMIEGFGREKTRSSDRLRRQPNPDRRPRTAQLRDQPFLDGIRICVFRICGIMPAGIRAGSRIRFLEHTNLMRISYVQASRNWSMAWSLFGQFRPSGEKPITIP